MLEPGTGIAGPKQTPGRCSCCQRPERRKTEWALTSWHLCQPGATWATGQSQQNRATTRNGSQGKQPPTSGTWNGTAHARPRDKQHTWGFRSGPAVPTLPSDFDGLCTPYPETPLPAKIGCVSPYTLHTEDLGSLFRSRTMLAHSKPRSRGPRGTFGMQSHSVASQLPPQSSGHLAPFPGSLEEAGPP